MPLLTQISRLQAVDAQLERYTEEYDTYGNKPTYTIEPMNLASCLLLRKRAELIQSITEMKEKNPEAFETIVTKILQKADKDQQIDNYFKNNILGKEYAVTPEEIDECLSELLSKENLDNLAETILAVGNQTAAPTDTEAGRRSVERWHNYWNERNRDEGGDGRDDR